MTAEQSLAQVRRMILEALPGMTGALIEQGMQGSCQAVKFLSEFAGLSAGAEDPEGGGDSQSSLAALLFQQLGVPPPEKGSACSTIAVPERSARETPPAWTSPGSPSASPLAAASGTTPT
jgi:hypothetical protein